MTGRRRSGRRHLEGGQAALEVLAGLPLLVLAALVAWQLAAVVGAGLAATEQARERAIARLAAPAGGAGVVHVEHRVAVPAVLPVIGALPLRARAVVRLP